VSTCLSNKPRFRDSRVQDMVDIDGEDLQETSLSGSGDGVRGVVRVGPCIGPMRKATVRKVVYDAFVGVLLGAHKDQARRTPWSGTNSHALACTHCSRVWGQPVSLNTTLRE
jgi:hypothetical protein